MEQEQRELLAYIHYILNMEISNTSETYTHTIEEAGKIETIEVSREQHLEEVMKWAAQEIEKHFDLVPEPGINKDLKLLDYRVQQILEGVLSESTTYGDARNKLETLKIIAESHFKTEHASVIYKLALKKLDKKINATPIKE